jgi:hypothetical protein
MTGKLLGPHITGTCKRVHFATLIAGHLNDNMGGRSETKEANAFRRPGHLEGTVSNQSRTQQWSSLQIRVTCRNAETEPFIRRGQFSKAAIDLASSKFGLVTQIFPAAFTIMTISARPAQPGNAYPIPHFESGDMFPHFDDGADNLMSRNEREFRIG